MQRSAVLLLIPAFLLSALFLNAQTTDEEIHAPDGGTRERIMSIDIPPLAGSPFSSTVSAEWARTLEDGTVVTIQNHRTVMRDSAGRIFQQRSSFVPKDGTQQSHVLRFEISDPKAHTRYICYSSRRTCEIEEYFATTNVSMVPAGPLDSKGDRYLTRESLGPNNMSGVDVTGTRETVTINTGVIGNDKPVSVVKEFWYSPKLGINVSVKRMDPRHGTQTFTISDISLSEPDPKYFSVPAGYTLVDHRRRSLQTAATHGN